MLSPLDMRSPRRSRGRKLALWAGLAVSGILPTVGCQVEYAGMTLPSGKYMHDDVQYFPPGPDFPWANTQAATQRARMQAMGLDIAGAPVLGNAVNRDPLTAPVQAVPGAPVGNIPQNVDPAGGPPPAIPGGPGEVKVPPVDVPAAKPPAAGDMPDAKP